MKDKFLLLTLSRHCIHNINHEQLSNIVKQVAQRATIAHLRTSKYFLIGRLKIFSIGLGQPTLQSMVGQNSDVNKGRNSVANSQNK